MAKTGTTAAPCGAKKSGPVGADTGLAEERDDRVLRLAVLVGQEPEGLQGERPQDGPEVGRAGVVRGGDRRGARELAEEPGRRALGFAGCTSTCKGMP